MQNESVYSDGISGFSQGSPAIPPYSDQVHLTGPREKKILSSTLGFKNPEIIFGLDSLACLYL
jgi:hypothetical protein